MRKRSIRVGVAVVGVAGILICVAVGAAFYPGWLREPARDTPDQVRKGNAPISTDPAGPKIGDGPGVGLRATSANVTLLDPGVLHSPDLPTLPPGGYYRILIFDSPNEKDFTFTAANLTGYGLFAASSPRLVEDHERRDVLDRNTTLDPIFLDGSRTAGAYNGSNKDLVLRPNAGGEPVLLSGYTSSAAVPALLTVVDGQTITVPDDQIQEGKEVLWLNYDIGKKTHGFVLVPVASSDPKLTVSDATLVEGDGGTTKAAFTVSLSPAAASMVTVIYATVRGTTTEGSDFTSASGTLTFLPGQTSKTGTVTVNADASLKRDLDFFLTLSSATHAVIADGVGLGASRRR
jgi:hypothetical protein